LPISKSAIKEARKSKKKHEKNKAEKTRIKTMYKKILGLKNLDEAKKLADKFIPELNRAATKSVFHKNNLNRKASKLKKHINALVKPS
jgi:small subunit ribosomal protein S20